MAETPVRE